MLQSSLYQAALILKSLPKMQAAKILSRLEAVDIKTVFIALDQVDGYSADEIGAALQKLADETGQDLFLKQDEGMGHFLDKLDANSVPTDVSPDISPSHRPWNSPLNPLANQPTNSLTDNPNNHPLAFIIDLTREVRTQLLRDEHPKNIAIVLSSLPPEIASDVLRNLDATVRVSVLRRLCDTGISAQEELAQLCYVLKLRLRKILNKNSHNKTGVDMVAELLSCADLATQRDVLAHMNQTDPELADKLEQSVFMFSDIQSLTDDETRTLLKTADTSLWAVALKKATLETRQKILSNMAAPAARLLSEEISTIGPIDDHISTRAQQQIVNLVLRIRRAENMGQTLKTRSVEPQSNSPYYVRT